MAVQDLSSRSRSTLLVLLAWPLALAAQEPDLDELLARSARFVGQYENNIDAVVADERYRQESGVGSPGTNMSGARGGRGSLPDVRELESEFLLLHVPGAEAPWASLRHVLRVDGRPVPDGERRFDAAVARSTRDAIEEWKRLNEQSRTYNIGPIARATNTPTFALVVLRAELQAQFSFRIDDAHERVEGFDTVVLAYQELDPPTLITALDGEKVYASGRIWMTPDDGRVIRTEIAMRSGRPSARVDARVIVQYGIDPQIQTWVPVQMEEQYQAGRFRVRCVARYTKYRWLDANR